jgi:hypothetical protein
MGILLLPAQAHGGSDTRNDNNSNWRGGDHDRGDRGDRGDHRGSRFIRLSGAAEVPAGSGDPDGSGRARVKIDADDGELCYVIKVRNIDAVVAAHIHSGDPTVDGPVVVDLSIGTAETRSNEAGTKVWFWQCLTGLDSTLLSTIKQNRAAYYLNVHTAAFPDGAVRGQLAKVK